jgi:hypothetical protein
MPVLHRHIRPFAVAAGLLILASAAWWMWPVPQGKPSQHAQLSESTATPDPEREPPVAAPQRPPKIGKEQLSAPAAQPSAELRLPGALPKLGGPIAPALADPEPPIESLEVLGQLHPSAGQIAARAAWPIVQRCAGDWRGDLHLTFGLAGGERVGDSRFWEPKVSGAPEQIQACITAELAQARTAAATDANGSIAVVYHVGRDLP